MFVISMTVMVLMAVMSAFAWFYQPLVIPDMTEMPDIIESNQMIYLSEKARMAKKILLTVLSAFEACSWQYLLQKYRKFW